MVLASSVLEETQLVKHVVNGVKALPDTVDYSETLGFAGITGDNTSKFLVVTGMVELVTSLVMTAPIVVKSVVVGSVGCFMAGFARGVYISAMNIKKENEHV